MKQTKGFILGLAIGLSVILVAVSGAVYDRIVGLPLMDKLFPGAGSLISVDHKLISEESAVITAAESVSPSVVTVTVKTPDRNILEFSPFGGFRQRVENGTEQDIGSGFIVSEDGLVITNKHVVSNSEASYKVVTKDGKEFDVVSINRDPANDVAIIKIDANGLKPVELGDSANLKVGQFVIAIGTALGEFRHTVTTGVISGLGRGITAGSAYEGYVERLDDVIQTDAAINPGNSGGPLLNSAGQVIGVNVAVAAGAQNIGFAIPIDIIKEGLNQFSTTGKFVSKAFLGVEYQMIDQRTAVMNQVPQGAYILNVVPGSPAEGSGLQEDDIVTKIDGKSVTDFTDGISEVISGKKPDDTISLEVWRDGQTLNMTAKLSEYGQ